jgi:hypothetical protein
MLIKACLLFWSWCALIEVFASERRRHLPVLVHCEWQEKKKLYGSRNAASKKFNGTSVTAERIIKIIQ